MNVACFLTLLRFVKHCFGLHCLLWFYSGFYSGLTLVLLWFLVPLLSFPSLSALHRVASLSFPLGGVAYR